MLLFFGFPLLVDNDIEISPTDLVGSCCKDDCLSNEEKNCKSSDKTTFADVYPKDYHGNIKAAYHMTQPFQVENDVDSDQSSSFEKAYKSVIDSESDDNDALSFPFSQKNVPKNSKRVVKKTEIQRQLEEIDNSKRKLQYDSSENIVQNYAFFKPCIGKEDTKNKAYEDTFSGKIFHCLS